MDEPNENASEPRLYKWPWVVLAAVGLGIVLAIVWMALKVQEIREQRDPMRYQQNWNDGNLKVVQGVQRILIFGRSESFPPNCTSRWGRRLHV